MTIRRMQPSSMTVHEDSKFMPTIIIVEAGQTILNVPFNMEPKTIFRVKQVLYCSNRFYAKPRYWLIYDVNDTMNSEVYEDLPLTKKAMYVAHKLLEEYFPDEWETTIADNRHYMSYSAYRRKYKYKEPGIFVRILNNILEFCGY